MLKALEGKDNISGSFYLIKILSSLKSRLKDEMEKDSIFNIITIL